MAVRGVGLEQMDAELAVQSQAEAALRLRLGQALEVLGRGACHELGFSSLTAYALERCERSARWVEVARCLARRLELLPALRHAVAFGRVSWSKAVLIARVATARDEARWVEAAQRLTVRQLTALLEESAAPANDEQSLHSSDSGEDCTLVCRIDQEEAWLFEATRALLSQLGTYESDEQLQALLAEAQGSLIEELPPGALDLEAPARLVAERGRWRDQLARWRTEAEVRCEEQVGRASASRCCAAPRDTAYQRGGEPFESMMLAAAHGCGALEPLTPRELDRVVRDLARALAEHEVAEARLLLAFHRADGWRLLGYASETHYARERLGMSRSVLLARRTLAVRLESSPRVAEALGRSRIGVEAALQLVRIATPRTEAAWLERAQQRTIKHLREEVNAALVAVRLSGETDCPPPAEAEIDAFQEIERAASSGRIFQPTSSAGASAAAAVSSASWRNKENAWRATLDSLSEWLAKGVQMCAGQPASEARSGVQMSAGGVRHIGRVQLRLRVSCETRDWWRSLERQARRWLPLGVSWFRFCCLSLWRAWRHLLNPDTAYEHIYIRDRHRCTSPVCSRRDVTPHHLRFRSAGGSDDNDNVAAVCTWCHLLGIHGGRIRATGTARQIRWELPCLVVEGRVRRAA